MGNWIRLFQKAAAGQPVSRREFLRGVAGATAAAAASRVPLGNSASPSAPIENLSANEWRELPAHLNAGFKFMGDGYATYYPHNHGPMGIGGDWVGANGQPPMWVDPPTMFDEVPQKEVDDFLQQLRNINYRVPGNDTDPATGLAHSEYRFNRHTGQWHPHYIREVRPNVFKDVYLEPGAPRPVELPEGFIDPVQRAYEDNPLWMHEQWPEWTTQGQQMLLEGRQRFLQNMADDWSAQAEADPETHRRNMENDPEYRRAYESSMEEVSRARGGRSNIGPQPAQPDVIQLTGNMGLPGDTPTERSGRIRRLLAMGVPLTAAVAVSSQASASEPSDQGMRPVEGQPGTFAFPDNMDAADVFPAEDLNTQRGIPVSYGSSTSEQRDHAAASARYEEEYEPLREEMAQAFVEQGMSPVAAELKASKLFELGRPTIRTQDGGVMSPEDLIEMFVRDRAQDYGIAEDGIEATVDSVIEHIVSGGGESQIGKDAQEMMLIALQTNAAQGPDSDRSGIPEEEFKRLEQKYGDNANFMYPDAQRTNFDALRQYELLTHGTDLFEPGHTSNEVLKVAGGIFNPEGLFGGSFTPGLTPDTPEGDALYWYKLSRNTKSDEPGYHTYRDPNNNDARFWSHSTTTMSGLMGGMGGDTSRRYGRWAAYTQPVSQNPTVPSWQRQLLTDVRTNTNRPVPIIPAGRTPKEMATYHDFVQRYDERSRDWLPSQYRKAVGDHPTFFQKSVMDMIHDSSDPATLADAGFSVATGGVSGAFGGAAKSAGRSLARAAGRGAIKGAGAAGRSFLREEAVYGAAQSAAMTAPFTGVSGFLTEKDNSNPLAYREDESVAQPHQSDYGDVVNQNTQRYRDALQRAATDYYRKKN